MYIKEIGNVGMDWIDLPCDRGFCEHDIGLSGFMECGELIFFLRTC
jgi:hypothetical protein